VFVKAFGGRQQGVRMTFEMEEKPGRLAELAQAIAERGGNIVAFAALEGDDLAHSRGTLKIAGIDKKDVEEAVKSVGAVLEDIREC
jgi:acetoin utilization protein AcuB